MPVQFNDVLQLPETSKWIPIPVQWRQELKSYEKNYYRVNFTNTRDDPEKSGVLFVSDEKLADFESQKMQRSDPGFQIKVDCDFVYGQKKDGTHRFLVYHDTNRDMFQHRFLEGVMNIASNQSKDIASQMEYNEIDASREFIAGTIGDPLRTF